MEPLAGLGGINCLYFSCLLAGGVYAVIILLTGAIQDVHLPHLDLGGGGHVGDLDGGTVKVPSLSPVTIASFITAFGAFGIISGQLLGASQGGTLLWAAGAGIVVAVLAHFAFGYFLIAPQGSSEVHESDVVGASAEVLVPVPADSVGEIALVAQGGRVTYPARSSTGVALPRGHPVIVDRVISGVAWIRPMSEEERQNPVPQLGSQGE